MDLRGRRVLITGASRGIGEAFAEAFAQAGARVVLVARNAAALEKLAAKVGGKAIACDLMDPAALAGLLAKVEADGPVDVLVNNAGLEVAGAIDAMTASEVEQVFRLNLIVPAELCRQVLPGMITRKTGHIVNISSFAASVAYPGMSTYAASKAGLSHFTSGLRADLKGTGVRTTLVEIGPVPTDMLALAQTYRPTADAFARAYRFGMLVDVPREKVAAKVVAAVRHERRHVRLPARGALWPAIAELPRKIGELFVAGLKPRA